MTKPFALETLLVLVGYLAGCAASPTTAVGVDDDRKSSSTKSSSKSKDEKDEDADDEKDEKADDDADDEQSDDDEGADDEASAERDEPEPAPTPARDAGTATAPRPTTTTPTRSDAGIFPARMMCTAASDCTQQCTGSGMPCCRTSGTCGCSLGSFCL